jgi:beta-galactosidase
MKFRFLSQIYLLMTIQAGLCFNSFSAGADTIRQRQQLDSGWKFYLGDPWGDVVDLAKAGDNRGPATPDFFDANWRKVNLPHDWAVELPFDPNADCNHGFKPVGPGFPQNNVAWYRRTFELSQSDATKRLWLEFDGVYRNCDVFVNGWFVGHHDDGYEGFRYDITDVVHSSGKNVVAVKVDASQFEGWFYEGAGIYRHVWLVKTSPLAIAPDGIFVHSQFKGTIPKGPAEIIVEASLLNMQPNAAKAIVTCEIISPAGKSLVKFKGADVVKSQAQNTVRLEGKVTKPELWSPESPKLYQLLTTVETDGKILDCETTEFGIRTVAYDSTEGFLLNGKQYEIKGTCNHQDAAGVGVALPDALQYFRIAKLKEMGCNAYRTSHNAPTPELLEACDRLGMLVLDENRLFGSDAANLARLTGQIIRDRNHPSIFTWSLGNEEWNAQSTATGAAVMQTMQKVAHSTDPTRQCTIAVNGSYGEVGPFAVSDVRGINYNYKRMDAYRMKHPNAIILGTEQASSIGTRGIYTNDASLGYISAYDDHNPRWGCSAEEWWSFFDTRPWLSGGFVWTGFDYRGEPTPYQWPCINSHFGILDTCGFPKDNFWYYQSWWTTNVVLHLLPHWNWTGKEGQEIDVRALSNCQEVELFLNGQSLGRQTMKRDSELKWKVKYVPGVLSANGYNDGRIVARTKVETTGEAAFIKLEPDRTVINADGEDISVITVSVRDARDQIVPVAANLIHFNLDGPGKILGVGNGDPTCHEPDQFIGGANVRIISENSDWRYRVLPDVKNSRLAELGTNFDDSAWSKADPQSVTGPLEENQQAIFRTKIQLAAEDLAAETVQLRISNIDDDGWLYVNGQFVGESYGNSPCDLEIKPFLVAGENTIAIAVANRGGPGGLNNGVTLELAEKAQMPQWQRSAFNGLAQIIVQSATEPGEIRLTATADGLTPATMQIQSKLGRIGSLPP